MSLSLLRPFLTRSRPTNHFSRRSLHSSRPVPSPAVSDALKRILFLSAGVAAVAYAFRPATVYLDSGAASLIPKQDEESTDTIIDPATNIAFPKTLRVPAKVSIPPHSLIGVGVRTVSFLRVQVYSVGFYADLNNPNLKITKDMAPDEKIQHIIQNTSCVVRIVPTRSTSYTHLRDAFMRALQGRIALGTKAGTVTEELALEVASPMRKLKSLFPNSPLAKHTPLDIFLSPPVPGKPRALVFRDLGIIESDWVATEFVLHYFEGQGPSPPLKKSVSAFVDNM